MVALQRAVSSFCFVREGICQQCFGSLMMNNVIEKKSFDFAVRIAKLNDYLIKEKKAFQFAKQIIKSGTSIGANVSEAQHAQSRADFISKMSIALKEAYETDYWLRVMQAADILSEKQATSLRADCLELCKLLSSIVKTSKEN